MSALEMRGLSVRYAGAGTEAVREVDMRVDQGEVKVLVGESGSGKSTLGLAAQQLLPRSSQVTGSVTLSGEPLIRRSRSVSRLRGRLVRYVPQDPVASLNPSRTIGSQLSETLQQAGIRNRRERARRSAGMLADVGIADPDLCLTLYPHELSGGMAQRVVIADCLLLDPPLIIADEPTAALDATTSVVILALMKRLATDRGSAVLLITHNVGHAAAIGDSVAVMYAGRVVEAGPVGSVLEDPRMPYTAALLASRATVANGRRRLPVIPGSPGPNPKGPQACVFSARCGYADETCGTAPAETVLGPGGSAETRRYRCWHPIGADR